MPGWFKIQQKSDQESFGQRLTINSNSAVIRKELNYDVVII